MSLLIPIQKDVDTFLLNFAKLKPSQPTSFIAFKTVWDDMHLHLIFRLACILFYYSHSTMQIPNKNYLW